MFSASSLQDLESISNPVALCEALTNDIEGIKNFIADRDALDIKQATSGKGASDVVIEDRLIAVLCNRTKAQLKRLDVCVQKTLGKSLLDVVTSEVGGNFGVMVASTLQPKSVLGGELFAEAFAGVGCDESLIIDLVNIYNNDELAETRKHWDAANDKPWIDKINYELKGDFKKLVLKLMKGSKHESAHVDPQLAEQQAERLYKAGQGKMFGTDEEAFIEVLSEAPRAQIQAIKVAYEHQRGTSLQRAIEKETSGDFKDLMVALLAPSTAAYVASALHNALEHVANNGKRIAMLLGAIDKADMHAVSAYYVETYGTALVEALRDQLTGDFSKAAVAWVAGLDPTLGAEAANKGLAADGGSDPRAASAGLLKERTNLVDYVAQADAAAVRRACLGVGTRDRELIMVMCARNKDHLKRVDAYYHKLYGMSLVQQVHEETSGYYQQLMEYAVLPTDEVDAMTIRQACEGFGTDELLIVETLAPLSNARISALKAKYEAKYGQALVDRIKSELGGKLRAVCLALLRAERREGERADHARAAEQAEALYRAGEGKLGTDEDTFITILTESSYEQIQAIKEAYEQSRGCSLEHAVRGETSGALEAALAALLYPPGDIYSASLHRVLQGKKTNDAAVARLLGANDKPAIAHIAARYLARYGSTLVEALRSNLEGAFALAAVTWVAASSNISCSALAALASEFTAVPDERSPDVPSEAPDTTAGARDLPEVSETPLVWVRSKEEEARDLEGEASDSDCGDSEASGHSSDGRRATRAGWTLTPEIESLIRRRRRALAHGHTRRARKLQHEIRVKVAEQVGAPPPPPLARRRGA